MLYKEKFTVCWQHQIKDRYKLSAQYTALYTVLDILIPTGLRVKHTTKLPEASDNY
jgi:hypothetical protein